MQNRGLDEGAVQARSIRNARFDLPDARIIRIYEGTDGIQAADLVLRKIGMDEGRPVASYLDDLRGLSSQLAKTATASDPEAGLSAGIEALADANAWLQERIGSDPKALAAGSSPNNSDCPIEPGPMRGSGLGRFGGAIDRAGS
jgi:hypothetical protein